MDVDVGVGAHPDPHEVGVGPVVGGGAADGEHRGQLDHVIHDLNSQSELSIVPVSQSETSITVKLVSPVLAMVDSPQNLPSLN